MDNYDEIKTFIKSNPKYFKADPANERSSWHTVLSGSKEVGLIWFKNILGGWGISLNGQERIQIDTVEVLKKTLQING